MSEHKTKHLSRREFLQRSSLVAGATVLAACAPQAPAAPAPSGETGGEAAGEAAPTAEAPAKEGVVVQFWTGWGELVPFFDDLKNTDEFRELMGPNDIEMKPAVSLEALLTAVAAGTPPDITSEAPYLDLMARDVLLPIDAWVENSDIINEKDFIGGNWERGKYNGTLYGVPAWECFVRFGLNYNARMVEEAGLDPDNPPVTWEEALEWHKVLTQFDDAGNLLQIGLDPYDAEGGGIGDGFFAARSWGFDWFDEETGTFNLDNPQMAEAFDVMGEFYRIAGPDNMAGMRSVEGQDTWGGSFNAEVQAMIIEGYWHPGETQAQKPEVAQFNQATWAPVPESRRGAKIQGTGGHYVIFFKDAKNTEEAFPFAEYLATNAACDLIFNSVGWLPAYKPYLEQADPSAYPGLDFYFRSVNEATEIEGPKNCPITSFVHNAFQELREEVYRDNMTAADAAAEFQKRVDQEWIDAGFAA